MTSSELETHRQRREALVASIIAALTADERIVAAWLTQLRHATGPLHEAVGKLYGGRVPNLGHGLGDYFRDVYDHLIRLNQAIDTMRDTVTTALQVNLAMIAVGESEVTKRLAAYAALVAVPTMIAGIYGMNFKHMPELSWEVGYPMALGLMVTLDSYLFVRFRKAKWI